MAGHQEAKYPGDRIPPPSGPPGGPSPAAPGTPEPAQAAQAAQSAQAAHAGQPQAGQPPQAGQETSGAETSGGRASALLRSGAIMALGTIASRLTGFLRTVVLIAALGQAALGDAYNTANTVPNIVYDLLLGGILTSVIVPLLVRAKERDRTYGEQYEQRIFTLAVVGLGALTVIAVALAPVLITIYAGSYQGDQRTVAVMFAWAFLPQIFFYGVGAFAGAILNTRGSFGAPMWAPVLNNIVVIVMGGAYLLMTTGEPTPENLSTAQFVLLAAGTTGGIVLQTIALWPSLRKVGFRWRPRFDFQRGEIGQITGMAGWTLVYVVLTQIGFAVITALSNSAGRLARAEGVGEVYGFTSYFTAYQLFQLPYAIVAVSVITALLPRMSEHAAEGSPGLVRDDFSSGLRLSSVIILPAAALLLVLAPEISTVLFDFRGGNAAGAAAIAHIMQAFAVALVPFSAYQLMLRIFYAYRDTRATAMIAVVTVGTNIAFAVTAYQLLDTKWVVVGIAAGFAVANSVGALVCWAVLRRKLGGLDGRRIVLTHLKLLVATWPLIGFAYATHAVVSAGLGDDLFPSLVSLVLGSAGGGILYLVFARLLRVGEVQTMLTTLTRRLPGRG